MRGVCPEPAQLKVRPELLLRPDLHLHPCSNVRPASPIFWPLDAPLSPFPLCLCSSPTRHRGSATPWMMLPPGARGSSQGHQPLACAQKALPDHPGQSHYLTQPSPSMSLYNPAVGISAYLYYYSLSMHHSSSIRLQPCGQQEPVAPVCSHLPPGSPSTFGIVFVF